MHLSGIVAYDYVFVRLIGRGGFGDVYSVQHRKTGAVYAAKVVPQTLDPAAAERLALELACLTELSAHPHVLRMHEFLPSVRGCPALDGYQVMILELADTDVSRLLLPYDVEKLLQQCSHPAGVSSSTDASSPGAEAAAAIARVLTREKLVTSSVRLPPLSLASIAQIVKHTAKALDFVHANGYTHGDVKLENLLVCKKAPQGALESPAAAGIRTCSSQAALDEESLSRSTKTFAVGLHVVKVADFGLATAYKKAPSGRRASPATVAQGQDGGVDTLSPWHERRKQAGSLYYLAPEALPRVHQGGLASARAGHATAAAPSKGKGQGGPTIRTVTAGSESMEEGSISRGSRTEPGPTGHSAAGAVALGGTGCATTAQQQQPQEGAGSIEPTRDVWALGVVFFALLTGTLPFRSESVCAAAVTLHAEAERRREEEEGRPAEQQAAARKMAASLHTDVTAAPPSPFRQGRPTISRAGVTPLSNNELPPSSWATGSQSGSGSKRTLSSASLATSTNATTGQSRSVSRSTVNGAKDVRSVSATRPSLSISRRKGSVEWGPDPAPSSKPESVAGITPVSAAAMTVPSPTAKRCDVRGAAVVAEDGAVLSCTCPAVGGSCTPLDSTANKGGHSHYATGVPPGLSVLDTIFSADVPQGSGSNSARHGLTMLPPPDMLLGDAGKSGFSGSAAGISAESEGLPHVLTAASTRSFTPESKDGSGSESGPATIASTSNTSFQIGKGRANMNALLQLRALSRSKEEEETRVESKGPGGLRKGSLDGGKNGASAGGGRAAAGPATPSASLTALQRALGVPQLYYDLAERLVPVDVIIRETQDAIRVGLGCERLQRALLALEKHLVTLAEPAERSLYTGMSAGTVLGLLQAMLHPDPASRPDMRTVSQHPWVQGTLPGLQRDLLDN